MNIRIKTDTITPELARLVAKFKDPKSAMQLIGDEVTNMGRDSFLNQYNRPATWPGLQPTTIARKKKAGKTRPLIFEGNLVRSLKTIEVGPTHALVGSDRTAGSHSLAAIHQLGAPKANIPARPFFPFDASGKATPGVVARAKEILLRWLEK